MRQHGAVTVACAANQGQPAAAVGGGAGSDLLAGGQGQADPLVCARAAVVGVVVNAELEVNTVLNVLLLLGDNGQRGGGVLVVCADDREALRGVLVTCLRLVDGRLLVGILFLIGIGVLACETVGSPDTVGSGRGADSHDRDHGQEHNGAQQKSNDALGVHVRSPFFFYVRA